jgi:hypothetical protein
MLTWKELLRATTVEPKKLDIPTFLQEVKTSLELLTSDQLHLQYATDVTRLIVAIGDLVGYLATPSYDVERVRGLVYQAENLLFTVDNYVKQAQQRYKGWAIINQKTGKMLPQLFYSEPEARAHITYTAPIFNIDPMELSVTQVIYAASRVNQPLVPPDDLKTLTPPPIPPTTPPALTDDVKDLPEPDLEESKQ